MIATVMMIWRMVLLCMLGAGLGNTARAQETTVRVANAPSIAAGGLLIAIERGYFKEVGIKVLIDSIDSASNGMALLAQNQFQVMIGGLAAGYFNALEKDLPITIAMSRVSTPLGHAIMLRSDLKDKVKRVRDLKGRVVASNGPGSVSTYEIGKILETDGLTLADVDVKNIPFAQYAVAFTNKAIDAALAIHPFTSQLRDRGFAFAFANTDELVEPRPITISVSMVNTDWAKKNPKVAENFFLAAVRGARDYCQAYHGGAIRKEMIDVLVKSGTERRPEMLNDYVWPAADPNGRVSTASMLDMQAWYLKNNFSRAQAPASRLVDMSYVEAALAKLPPFEVENKASKLAGCR